MTEQERTELKVIIKRRIEETRKEIEHLKELTKPVAPDNAIGRLSRMDAFNNKTINEASLRENTTKLKKLERAKERISEERFENCTKCGGEIAFGRITFMSWTTRCVGCA